MPKHRTGFDHGHGGIAPRTYKIKAFDFTSKKEGNAVGAYADNAMEDPSMVNEAVEQSHLEILHSLLSKAGVSDEQIKDGIELKDAGYDKVAAALGIAADDVQPLIDTLKKRLNGEDETDILNELTSQTEDTIPSDIKAEIESDVGTMEFPFKIEGKSGYATAAYKFDGTRFYIKIADAYDENGDMIGLSEEEKKLVRTQAIDFIGDE